MQNLAFVVRLTDIYCLLTYNRLRPHSRLDYFPAVPTWTSHGQRLCTGGIVFGLVFFWEEGMGVFFLIRKPRASHDGEQGKKEQKEARKGRIRFDVCV